MSELVTGDAVVLGLRPARVPTRAFAVFIDLLLVWTLYVLLALAVLAGVSSLDTAAVAAVQVALFVLVPVGVPIAVETLTRGRSLGKLVCGLRVVREDGGPVRFRHALVRGAVGVVEIQLSSGVIACIASLVSARGRRLGDVFAGTLVVRERMPTVSAQQAPGPPPWLTGRFAGADLSRVPEPLWLAVRQYLMRANQLDGAVGADMAEKLASDLAAHIGAPPPGDVPPAAYLAAVLAERQSRDAQRAFGAPRSVPQPGPSGPGAGPSPGRGPSPPAGPAPDAVPPEEAGPDGAGPQGARPDGAGPDGAAAVPGSDTDEREDAVHRPPHGFVPPA